MPARPPRLYRQLMAEQQATLARLTEQRGAAQLKDIYEKAVADLERKLRSVGDRASFTAHHLRTMLLQAKQGVIVMQAKMAGKLGELSLQAQVESLRGLTRQIAKLELEYRGHAPALPIDQAEQFTGIIGRRRTSIMRVHRDSMARYGADNVKLIEDGLAQSLIQGETTGDAIDRIISITHGQFYQAERIARTELSWAFNSVHRDGIISAATVLPGLMSRWSEHVDDLSGQPFDNRVGEDSLAMHGQVAPPGGRFTMPPETPDGKPVSKGLVGMAWDFPPNRPNDRAVLDPWHADWGIPGWQWRDGRRSPVVAQEAPAGDAGAAPDEGEETKPSIWQSLAGVMPSPLGGAGDVGEAVEGAGEAALDAEEVAEGADEGEHYVGPSGVKVVQRRW